MAANLDVILEPEARRQKLSLPVLDETRPLDGINQSTSVGSEMEALNMIGLLLVPPICD